MINIPNQNSRQWRKSNESDLFGNLFVTKNITFDDVGYLKLSYSPRAVITEATSGWDSVSGMVFTQDYEYFVAGWDNAWSVPNGILADLPTQIATAGVPSTDIESDCIVSDDLLIVTQDTDVDFYNQSTNAWTDTNISLTAGSEHPVVNFVSLSAFAIADVNEIKLYVNPITASPNLITTCIINANYEILQMVYFNQNLYIATEDINGGNAYMFVWNGLGTAAQQAYKVDSPQILSICAHNNEVYIITSDGALQKFNGAGFTFVDGFPIYYTRMSMTNSLNNYSMHKNVMKSTGDYIYILFNNDQNDDNALTYQPDGLWCYDQRVGLYHKYSVTNSVNIIDNIPTTDVNTTTNEITVTTAPVTGTEVYYHSSSTAIGGLVNEQKYYTIKVDATHVKLAETLEDAIAGTAIDLTGTGNVFQDLIFFPNIDYGQYYCDQTNQVFPMELKSENINYGIDAMWSAEVVRRDNAGSYATFGSVAPNVQSRGYFITPKIFSEDITDNYNKLVLKFSPFISEMDKIIIKYRTVDDMVNMINLADWDMTWTSANTFTSTETGWANAVVGNEVEILTGAGGGLLAHITAISENAGTYTVTLDDTYDNYTSGDIGRAIFRNWKKWKTIEYGDSNANQYYIESHIGAKGKFLQLKIELRGVQVRIEELLVDNIYQLPAKDR